MAIAQPITLAGVFTIAAGASQLPSASDYPRSFAWASDRADGAGYVTSDGMNWIATGSYYINTITAAQTAGISINAGPRPLTFTGVSGVTLNMPLTPIPDSTMPAGYAVINALATGTGAVTLIVFAPLLVIGAGYSFPVRLYRLR